MSSDGASSFGELLRRHRAAAALSQEELAARSGLSPRGISDLERGARTAPRMETVRLLADALGLDDDERAALLAARAAVASGGVRRADTGERRPLPVQHTPLVGRDLDLSRIQALLLDRQTRLVTLTGTGGVGKTRLAIATAAAVADHFPDEVLFVSLASITDPALVPATVAQRLGARDAPGAQTRSPAALIGDRALLLVLDNVEHLLESAPFVAQLLISCPRLRVLATSRERLRISGERTYPVAPLAVPNRGVAAADDLLENPAVRLFVERAWEIDPDLDLSTDHTAAIAEICRRVDGLPLAIELAAAQAAVLPPQALLSHMEERLPFLVGGTRDAPERHRTLRDAIAWSHDLLDPAERAMFRRLAVFAGGFTVEAVEALAGDRTASPSCFGTLASLVAKSLVQRTSGSGAEPRFDMLETVREFARERLSASGEGPAVHRAHAAWFLSWAEALRPHIEGPEGARTLQRFETEHPNLRNALRFLTEGGEAEQALRLVGALWKFWYVHRHTAEYGAWFERVLALEGPVAPGFRAEALYAAGSFAFNQGDFARAIQHGRECLTISVGAGDRLHAVMAHFLLGNIARHQDRHEEARAAYESALTLAREPERLTGFGEHMAGMVLASLGDMAYEQGNLLVARAHNEEALGLWQRRGDTWGMAISLLNLATVTAASGDLALAAELHRQSLSLYRDLGDRAGAAYAFTGLAIVASLVGNALEAARLFGVAEGLRAPMDLAVPRMMQQDYDRAIVAGRTTAGHERFGEAWSAGRSITIEEAFALATTLRLDAAPPRAPVPFGLSPREREVLRLIAAGRSNQQVADALSVSRRTATTHATNILNKLGLDSRAELIAFAFRHGLA